MNNRHRRVTKLRKQELYWAVNKFEEKYGVTVEDAIKALKRFAEVMKNVALAGSKVIQAFEKREEKE